VCGICAGFSAGGHVTADSIRAMMSIARHRGPDGFGLAMVGEHDTVDVAHAGDLEGLAQHGGRGRVVLGHCRLAVVDTSELNAQPRRGVRRASLISYNGEIYNHHELRDELVDLGHDFQTRGDTEVLLAAIDEWGVDALPRLRGMFAFIHVDTGRKTVLVARDEFGIKPLYRWEAPDGSQYFASEIKQFTTLRGWRSVVDLEAMQQFIGTGITDVGGRTLFRGVTEVRPGSAFIGDGWGSAFREVRWARNVRGSGTQVDFDEALVETVRMHLRSDVEVGACLSGGMDSSALVAVASSELSQHGGTSRLRSFTAKPADPALDESAHAESVGRRLDIETNMVGVRGSDLSATIGDVIWHQDLPISGASVIAQWLVFKAIKDAGLKVVLDGQGADELLGGYDDYVAAAVLESAARGRLIRAVSLFRAYASVGRIDLRRLVGFAVVSYAPQWLAAAIRNRRLRTLRKVAPELVGRRQPLDDDVGRGPVPRWPRPTRMFDALRRHQLDVGLRMLLRFEDRNSMAMSVESRVPFLDLEFARCCLGLRASDLVTVGSTKAPLRDALVQRVGRETWDRRDKIGFAVPQRSWLEENSAMVRTEVISCLAHFSSADESTLGVTVDALLMDRSQAQLVWRLFRAGIWMHQFAVRTP